MEIYLTDLETGDRMRFPILPEKINVHTGAIFQSYTILGVGDIELPAGEELTGFSWNSLLPGKARENDPYIKEWRNPQEIQVQWSVYRAKKKKLRLLVTETPINHDVFIQRYNMEYSGGYGDFTYNIYFIQAKDLKVHVSGASGQSATPGNNLQAQERPSPPPPRTHTVVSGDNLWRIAQRYLGAGSRYGEIYNANSDTIEAEARRRGMSSSNNGHWIFPGTVLTIP
jgi:nucleoid-associated protein YgaU